MSYNAPETGSGTAAVDAIFDVAAANDPIPAYQRVHAECPVARTHGMFGDGVCSRNVSGSSSSSG